MQSRLPCARGTPRRRRSSQVEEEAPGCPKAPTARAACSGTRAGSLRMEVEMLSCRRELRTAAGTGDKGAGRRTYPGEDGAARPRSSPWNGGTARSRSPSRCNEGTPTLRDWGEPKLPCRDTALGHFRFSWGVGVTGAWQITEHELPDIPQISPPSPGTPLFFFPSAFPSVHANTTCSGCHSQAQGHLLGRSAGREQCWSSQVRDVWVRLSILAVDTMSLKDSKSGRIMILNWWDQRS